MWSGGRRERERRNSLIHIYKPFVLLLRFQFGVTEAALLVMQSYQFALLDIILLSQAAILSLLLLLELDNVRVAEGAHQQTLQRELDRCFLDAFAWHLFRIF